VSPVVIGIVLISTIFHVSWNLIAKQGSFSPTLFLRILLCISVPGLVVAVGSEIFSQGFLAFLWPLLLGASFFEALYFLGLTVGYRVGDLGVIYPIARALPVLLLGVFDMARGLSLSAIDWLGLGLVALGCLVVSLSVGSARDDTDFNFVSRLFRRGVGWAIVAAFGTVGYSAFDKLAAEAIQSEFGSGLTSALRYGLWEFSFTTALYVPMLIIFIVISKRRNGGSFVRLGSWGSASGPQMVNFWGIVAAAVLLFVAYSFVLWAFQLTDQTSNVVALRQFSIVLGVVAGAVVMKEEAPVLRIIAALIITIGVVLVSL
jgi:drug/metabolite transporter (DMT)-like permease|tara:strand:+ start:10423 stop:11373 length:951 start_codon:yes stop_codon:yes gene_type:complete